MMVFTIGFTQKSAEEFFEILLKNNIRYLVDIRLNVKSQLAGFAKGRDLPYFLEKICEANYIHELEFAPTEEILSDYKKGSISWDEYEKVFRKLLIQRNAEAIYYNKYRNLDGNICFLCSEPTADMCHRRLLAEYLLQYGELTGVKKVVHL